MDLEIVYALTGILILLIVIVFTLRAGSKQEIKSKTQKREQILREYEKELKESLETIVDNKQLYVNKKSDLLKKISSELSRNIFFDPNEIKEIILYLSKKY